MNEMQKCLLDTAETYRKEGLMTTADWERLAAELKKL